MGRLGLGKVSDDEVSLLEENRNRWRYRIDTKCSTDAGSEPRLVIHRIVHWEAVPHFVEKLTAAV